MISVRNRLQPLSGSRALLFVIITLLAAACSPKLQPVSVQPVKKEPEKPVANNQVVKPVKPPGPKVSTISLLLPFGLDHLAPGSIYTYASLKKANIAVEYYEGFKLALDSLSGQGYNYKLKVFDTRDETAMAHSLGYNKEIRASDLVVGPVFPEGIKAFTAAFTSAGNPIVSPLSPGSPSKFKNQNLITIMPPLECHASAAAKYINDEVKPKKIFVLKSGFSEENDYIIPFKNTIDSLGKKRTKIIEITVIHGQLNALIPQLSAAEKNVFIVPATDQHFLTITLHALDTLNNRYPVTLYGHPGWINFSFLKADLLQRLDTHITSGDQVDYKAAKTIDFIQSYRNVYHDEPTEYAIKGFDEGMYFGQLLAAGELNDPGKIDFAGLHNSFHLVKKPEVGWVNTHVDLLKYTNFELKKVE